MSREKYEAKQWERLQHYHKAHPDWKVKEMAAAMHVPKASIYTLIRYHDYEIDLRTKEYAPRFDVEDKKLMVSLFVRGKKITDIAQCMGCANCVVTYWLRKYGVKEPRARNPRFLERDIQIAKLSAEGKKDKEIGRIYGWTEYRVGNYKTAIRKKVQHRQWWDIYEELMERKKMIYERINNIQKQEDND